MSRDEPDCSIKIPAHAGILHLGTDSVGVCGRPGSDARPSPLLELFRTLRIGGLLVATIWTSQVVPLNQLWNDVMRVAGVTPPPGIRLPPDLDFERTVDGFAEILADAGFGPIDCEETNWVFTISPDDLWVAVEAGIAVIGQTYLAQDVHRRRRMRAAYKEITCATRGTDGDLLLPSIALVASARRPR